VEGGPLTVLESLSAGCPVLGSDALFATNRFIIDGINGYVVPNSDSNELLEKMKVMIQWDNSKREQIFVNFISIKNHKNQFDILKKAICEATK